MSNRTQKGLKNSYVALIYYVLSILLGFISRKVFIVHLGADLLGLNTTAQNLLGFLNLAELGIGSAIAFTLYRPLAVNDKPQVNEIVTRQGWLYKKIANVVVVGAVILSCFFPWIFANTGLPLWYAYASFGVYLYSSLLTYYVNFKQIVLSANQEEYKITYSYKFVLLFQLLFQIIAISYFPHPYLWWLVIQFTFSSIAAISLNRVIRRDYPYLRIKLSEGKALSRKYPIIIKKVKQLFVHKISGFVLTQTSPLIIYAYTTLRDVALYGNYMLIINNVTYMFTSVFNGVTAGVGNLVAEGDNKKIMNLFQELFSARFFLATIFIFTLYKMIDPFIVLWLGEDFVMSKSTLIVMLGIMYIMMTRTTIDAYISAYGLYQDIYAPVIEACLNLGLSILLGMFYGITGILSGSLISMIIIVLLWKPYFVFTRAFKEKLTVYVNMYLKHISCFIVSAMVASFLLNYLLITPTNFLYWAIDALIVVVVFALILFMSMMLFTTGMGFFYKRVLFITKRK